MFLGQAKGPAHSSFEHCGNIFGFLFLGPEIAHHQGLDKIADDRAFILQVIVQTQPFRRQMFANTGHGEV